MPKLIKLLPTTSFDYSSLGNSAMSEVMHGELICTVQYKELVLIPRVSARVVVSGGSITVIAREVFVADDDAGDITGADVVTQVISSGASAFVARVSGGLPEYVRVLTKFQQPSGAGALLSRHSINVVLGES